MGHFVSNGVTVASSHSLLILQNNLLLAYSKKNQQT